MSGEVEDEKKFRFFDELFQHERSTQAEEKKERERKKIRILDQPFWDDRFGSMTILFRPDRSGVVINIS